MASERSTDHDDLSRRHDRERAGGQYRSASSDVSRCEAMPPYSLSLLGNDRLARPGNQGPRLTVMRKAQQTHGNRAVQRLLQRSTDATLDDAHEHMAQRISMEPRCGNPLDLGMRSRLEAGFGADLSHVRLHTDAQASSLAESVDAVAFTHGSDIYFRDGVLAPSSDQGLRVLAHEVTHVVQQDRSGGPLLTGESDRPSISRSSDHSEMEAHEAAGRIMSGERVQVSARPTAAISRFGFGDFVRVVGGPLGGLAYDTGENVSEGQGFSEAIQNGYTSEVARERQMAGLVRKGVDAADSGIDWLEKAQSDAAHWAADKAQGIPVLEDVASAGAGMADAQAQFGGGALKGATGLAGSMVGMVADPIDTIRGFASMAEHGGIPGMPNPLSMAHNLYDFATGNKSAGEALNSSFNPVARLEENAQAQGDMMNGFLEPYKKSWNEGKYAEVGGRAAFDVASFFFGGGEAKAAEMGDTARVAGELGKGSEVARTGQLGDAARTGEVLSDATHAEAGVAKRAPKVAETKGGKEVPKPGEAGDVKEAPKTGETDPASAKSEAKSEARAKLEAERVEAFKKFTGQKSISLADAPKEMTIPKEMAQGMENAWNRSARDLERGMTKEHGGILVQDAKGNFVWKGGKPGTKDAFYPNWQAVGKDQTLIGSGHTHPFEEGHTMSLSGEDIASLVDTQEKMQIVQSEKGQFASGRTAEFDARLKGLSKAEKQALKDEMIKTYDEIYNETKGTDEVRAKAAAQATHAKYGLAYYEGQGGLLMRK